MVVGVKGKILNLMTLNHLLNPSELLFPSSEIIRLGLEAQSTITNPMILGKYINLSVPQFSYEKWIVVGIK